MKQLKTLDPDIVCPNLKLASNSAFEHCFELHEETGPTQLPGFGAYGTPVVPSDPKLITFSPSCAHMLGLDQDKWDQSLIDLFSGAAVLEGTRPFAMNYGGHQFGHWAGQLGDGRALNLFEVHGKSRYAVQLKGVGPTAFSRRGDGFAVLRSSIREFIGSEAMHALGVPTTRALSLIVRGDDVLRDMFYDGNAAMEPSAVVSRVAPSFIRFGHFELPARRGDLQRLEALLVFTIKNYFPALQLKHDTVPSSIIVAFFTEVVRSTAKLVSHWQSLGFTHGVLNTDNMSIHGITLDYGPYGWLEPYDSKWTPNTTDAGRGRYAFGEQPKVALWNLWQLGNALAQLGDQQLSAALSQSLGEFQDQFQQYYNRQIASKLGLAFVDLPFVKSLEQLLESQKLDMVIFFRGLSEVMVSEAITTGSQGDAQKVLWDHIQMCSYHSKVHRQDGGAKFVDSYIQQWRDHNSVKDGAEVQLSMNQCNPKYVPRNYMMYEAIQAAEAGDFSPIQRLCTLLQTPFGENGDWGTKKRPAWAERQAGCSALSCSS